MLRRIAFGCCFFGLLTTALNAQIQVGAGSQSCGQWVEARRGNTARGSVLINMVVSWVQGYLVGPAIAATQEITAPDIAERIIRGELPPDIDLVLSDPQGRLLAIYQAKFGTRSGWVFDPPDSDAINVWLDAHCRARPLEDIFKASDVLLAEVDKRTRSGTGTLNLKTPLRP